VSMVFIILHAVQQTEHKSVILRSVATGTPDYLTNPEFRRELLRILNYGEAVHVLQRAMHNGSLGPQRGRRHEELVAISGSLNLLTNLVLAWTTHKIHEVLNSESPDDPIGVTEKHLRHILPGHFEGINLNGVFYFPIQKFAHRLLAAREQAVIGIN